MWNEAKCLYEHGDRDELSLMMETIKETFEEKEASYNEAVKDLTEEGEGLDFHHMTETTAANVKLLGREFDRALTSYNASLNIQFDLDGMYEKEANKIDIQISDEAKAEIKETVSYLWKSRTQLIKMMKFQYE